MPFLRTNANRTNVIWQLLKEQFERSNVFRTNVTNTNGIKTNVIIRNAISLSVIIPNGEWIKCH